MTHHLRSPAAVAWAAAAVPLFLVALVVLSQDVLGPFEWDGRSYDPHPARAAVEFLPAAIAFLAFVIGVARTRRRPFALVWALATLVWAVVLIAQPQ